MTPRKWLQWETMQTSQAASIKQVTLFFGLAYGLTWLIWLSMILLFPHAKLLHPLGSLGPLLAAFLAASLTQGNTGIRNLLSTSLRWRVQWYWYLLVLAGPFLLYALAAFIVWLINGTVPQVQLFLETGEFGRLGLAYWLISILFYGFGEEVGWRGFALPRLITAGVSPVMASAGFSLIWALWHLPLFWAGSLLGSMSAVLIVGWYSSLLLSSYLLTWLWQSANHSVFIVALFHGTVDIVVTTRAAEGWIASIISVLLLLLGLLVVKVTAPDLKTYTQREKA